MFSNSINTANSAKKTPYQIKREKVPARFGILMGMLIYVMLLSNFEHAVDMIGPAQDLVGQLEHNKAAQILALK